MPIRWNDDEARFFSKTKRVGDCLLWTAGVDKDGYGKFQTGTHGNQKNHRAHRWIFEHKVRKLKPGELLRHRCDNEACVDLDHLVPGSQLDNVHDALSRGRRVQALTPDLVRHLRGVHDRGESIRSAAMKLQINYWTAYAAAKRKTWKHLQ